MKSFGKTLLFTFVVCSVAAVALYDYQSSLKETESKEESLFLVQLKPDEIVQVEFITRNSAQVVEKKEKRWYLTTPLEDEADQRILFTLLNSIVSEKSLETVVEGDAIDLKPYGLDDPVTTLKLTDVKGDSQVIKIGAVKAYDSNLYAQVGDEKKVLLVSANWDLHLTKTTDQLRSKGLFRWPGKPEKVSKIQIHQIGKGLIELTRVNENWQLTKGGDGYPVANDLVNTYIDQVKSLLALEIHAHDKKAPGVIKAAGLESPELEVRFFADGEKPFYNLQVHKELATSSDVQTVLKVYETAIAPIAKTANDFYDRKKPFSFKPDEVSQIKFEAGTLKAQFVRVGDQWKSANEGLQNGFDHAKLEKLPERLARLEAIRILAPLSKPGELAKKKLSSRIEMANQDGEKIFEFSWGEVLTEGGSAEKPEAKYLLASTSKTDRYIAVMESGVESLAIEEIFVPSQTSKEKEQEKPQN